MKLKNLLFYMMLICASTNLYAQKVKSDANVVGHVQGGGEHLPFVNVSIKGTTTGTMTDETGHYQLVNLPVGEQILVASCVGFKTEEEKVVIEKDKTIEVKFVLEPDVLQMNELVISGNRTEEKRTDAPVIVNTISPKLFNATQSVTLSESLNFSPGLRLENNCQNCGFTQVRMNGMEGPYSQILINNRPVFSGLAGVYGLELLPTNMIERIEVVRGGGSALYGGNAIAGTINIILKEPESNSYEVGMNYGISGVGIDGSEGNAADYSVNLNASLVSDDHKTGVAVFGFSRDRKMFDANRDGYSEISPMNNLTIGSRLFHRFGYRNRLSLDLFNIKEERDGGNKQDYPIHERDVAEVVKHDLKSAAITFEQYMRKEDLLAVYASTQFLDRDSYYGAGRSLSSYGKSKDNIYNLGAQYEFKSGKSSCLVGIENTGDYLTDKKLGYPDYKNAVIIDNEIIDVPHTENVLVADQSSLTTGIFGQYELKMPRAKFVTGVRFDRYSVQDRMSETREVKSGNVISPRISLMYEITSFLKARTSYSQGYRAPQIFDEDLHIETSESRQVINKNDPDLKQETSHSAMASLDFNKLIGTVYTGILMEGFYTRLDDPFVNDIGTPDEEGTVIYTRKNADGGAEVYGVNIELKLKPLQNFSWTSGFTIQKSVYDEPQEFNETRFFRTPDQYGYFSADWDFVKSVCLSLTGNYSGKMLVPYFGTETDPDTGELRTSDRFFDMGAKIRYSLKLNGASVQWFCGVKNIFNSYQSDFDIGPDRDPSYIYGPVNPRTIYFGIRLGNNLN